MPEKLPPIAFHPRPSRELVWVLIALQCLTLVVLLFAQLPWGARLLLLGALLAQAAFSHRRLGGAKPDCIAEVRIDAEHAARLIYADGRELRTRVRGDSLVTPWLILLRFDGGPPLRRPTLLIGRDSITPGELRRLRVLLRFG